MGWFNICLVVNCILAPSLFLSQRFRPYKHFFFIVKAKIKHFSLLSGSPRQKQRAKHFSRRFFFLPRSSPPTHEQQECLTRKGERNGRWSYVNKLPLLLPCYMSYCCWHIIKNRVFLPLPLQKKRLTFYMCKQISGKEAETMSDERGGKGERPEKLRKFTSIDRFTHNFQS